MNIFCSPHRNSLTVVTSEPRASASGFPINRSTSSTIGRLLMHAALLGLALALAAPLAARYRPCSATIIDATLGQPDAATLTSANSTIVGGFWALQNLEPASGLPQLDMSSGRPGKFLL